MQDINQNIADIIYKHLAQESLTPGELAQLNAWLASDERHVHMLEEFRRGEHLPSYLRSRWNAAGTDTAYEKFTQRFPELQEPPALAQRISPGWFWAAASLLLLLAAGTYLLVNQSHQTPPIRNSVVHNDIAPGSDGAILTLADGSKIVLDSLANKVIPTQGGVAVGVQNGELFYKEGRDMERSLAYNTITTPVGRQYQFKLPDGTRVWLNAASSLTYPVSFDAGERKLNMTGEVYFEVASDPQRPFRVQYTLGAQQGAVQVLGTHFNINAYRDEAAVTTTLLEGAVEVSKGTEKVLIKPGMQAVVTASGTNVGKANTEQAIAWKNGVFNFHRLGLQAAMRQLSRWYGVEIIYEKNIPDIEFGGRIQRSLSLSQVIKGLGDAEVQFRIEGNKLIVSPGKP